MSTKKQKTTAKPKPTFDLGAHMTEQAPLIAAQRARDEALEKEHETILVTRYASKIASDTYALVECSDHVADLETMAEVISDPKAMEVPFMRMLIVRMLRMSAEQYRLIASVEAQRRHALVDAAREQADRENEAKQ